MKLSTRLGRIYCDTGPNQGMYAYDGRLYLTPDEEAAGVRDALAGGDGLPVVTPGRFELRDSGPGAASDIELACAGCGHRLCDAEAGDDLAVLVSAAAGHQCAAGGGGK